MLSDKICDYVDQIDQLDTAYDVFKYTRKLGSQFGADRFSIVALDDAKSDYADLALVNNWDSELLMTYDEENLADVSCVLEHCETGKRPMEYQVDKLPKCKKAKQRRIAVELLNDFKMSNGLACPTVATNGVHGGVSFASSKLDLRAIDVPNIHLLSSYLFNRLLTISDYSELPGKIGTQDEDLLSPREEECLTWAAAGKTAAETAIILDISANTTTHYLTSATQKLNASNRVHAVAEALRRGLLT